MNFFMFDLGFFCCFYSLRPSLSFSVSDSNVCIHRHTHTYPPLNMGDKLSGHFLLFMSLGKTALPPFVSDFTHNRKQSLVSAELQGVVTSDIGACSVAMRPCLRSQPPRWRKPRALLRQTWAIFQSHDSGRNSPRCFPSLTVYNRLWYLKKIISRIQAYLFSAYHVKFTSSSSGKHFLAWLKSSFRGLLYLAQTDA